MNMKFQLNSMLISKVVFFFSIFLLLLEIIISIVLHESYGAGLMYHLLIIMPIIYLTIGILGIVLSKWWLLLIAFNISFLIYIIVNSRDGFVGVLPFVAIYNLISVFVGLNCNNIRKKHKC